MVDNYSNPYEHMPVRTEETHYVVRDLEEGAVLFPNKRTTYFDPLHGAKTVEEVTIYQAGCGHFVGYAPAELRSHCDNCGKSLCVSCSTIHCSSCLKRLCTGCSYIWNQSIYCPRDHFLQLIKHGFVLCWQGITWILRSRIE
ncbi:MAG: hypothetical protein GY761_13190 [Hyphomicrobiales bacterium]|nr:hypothetical protein [Hyphomicrobiales bacterium]